MSIVTLKQQWITENLKQDESYAGIVLSQTNEPDYHLVILPGEMESGNWEAAKKFAKQAGGVLPTRRECRILYANADKQFQPKWYWSNEQHAHYSDSAWVQDFSDGYQNVNHKSNEFRARAVRRILIIQ